MAVIALLTDFGTRDHYAGTMKGVILGIAPSATLVDISHDIAPQDVPGGARQLAAAFRYFPAGTIFLAVIDPGVGTARRALAGEAGGYRFVAPDNGLLTLVFREAPPERLVELRSTHDALDDISATFEGRDRFAPAAARLAAGIDLAALGPPLDEWQQLDLPEPSNDGVTIRGVVVDVDRFGNVVTNIPRGWVDGLGPARVTVAGVPVAALVATYAEMPAGAVCALFGSTNHLEIAIDRGSAAERLALARGAIVEVRRVLK